MGAGRTISALLTKYDEMRQYSQGYEPPSMSSSTLYKWAKNFHWSERSDLYDATWEQRKNDLREQALNEGLALDFERIAELKQLALLLRSQIYEQGKGGEFHNLWVPDVKQIGSGEFVERVDIERYNSALISDYRAVLDDLAKEVGDRVKKSETDLTSGGEKLDFSTDRAIAALLAAQKVIRDDSTD